LGSLGRPKAWHDAVRGGETPRPERIGAVLFLTSVVVGAILCTLDQVGRGSESALAVYTEASRNPPAVKVGGYAIEHINYKKQGERDQRPK
jgi:hypothetical protein